MKPPPLRYEGPESLGDAVALLAEAGDEAKVLAGGQSLVPLLNMRMARPTLLVDINRIAGLGTVEAADGGVRVGAVARQSAAEASRVVQTRCPLLAECLPYVGHFVTRNRGTVAGSIAHADASAELPLVLLTLAGSVVAVSARGRRVVPADELFVTHFTTTLEADELIVETLWPGAEQGSGFAFEELAQRTGDYALAMAACALRLEEGRVAAARIGLGAVSDRPTLASEAAALLAGQAVDGSLAREAGAAAARAVEPAGDLHASSAYRRHLTAVLVERAVRRAWRNAQEAA